MWYRGSNIYTRVLRGLRDRGERSRVDIPFRKPVSSDAWRCIDIISSRNHFDILFIEIFAVDDYRDLISTRQHTISKCECRKIDLLRAATEAEEFVVEDGSIAVG
ncbi:hypothetical protein WT56_07750 [Burkholderia pseudomultivorans]|uniref:Uncharacterized protein n=1 Tax=Burkholderia pseudomultivorans TaxID=1207504 RepID=A0A132EL78_9BURK|nr:hypothetical protein WT56_07750 [Burkholderia pseudomultivorans]